MWLRRLPTAAAKAAAGVSAAAAAVAAAASSPSRAAASAAAAATTVSRAAALRGAGPTVRTFSSSAAAALSSMSDAPPQGPAQTRVHHPITPAEAWRKPDAAALAAEGLEAKFAVINLKTKQYKVTKDDLVVSDKIEGLEPGQIHEVDEVHLVGTPEYTVVGRPFVSGGKVRLQVEEQAKDAKVIVFKKKRRKNYRRKQGFRREVTILRVLDIEEGGAGAGATA